MEYNEVAAKWWADKIRNASPKDFDMGESGYPGLFGMMFGMSEASNNMPQEDDIKRFESRLSEKIKEEVEANGDLTLSVDYGLDYILGEIARETGISEKRFPWKVSMLIMKDKITVRDGYVKPVKVIFPTKTEKG